jgi:hypothetical protein
MSSSGRLRRALAFAGVVLLSSSQGACDPCFGTLPRCSVANRLAVEGRIVENGSGRSVEHAAVTLVVSDTVKGTRDSISTEADGAGFFQLSVDASVSGKIPFDVIVQAPSQLPYRVAGLRETTTRVRGESHDLGVWVAIPYFNTVGELVRRCAPARKFANVPVTVRSVYGPPVSGLNAGGVFTAVTDGSALFNLFDHTITPSAADTIGVVVEATVKGERLASGVRMGAEHLFRVTTPLLQIPMAPESTYVGCIYDRALVTPVANIQVDFTRTGGVPTAVATYSTVSDSDGAFALRLGPATDGAAVIGDLTVHSRFPSQTYTQKNQTFFSVSTPGAVGPPLFGVGLHLPYFVTITRGGVPQQGIHLVAKRTGGILAPPDSIVGVSDAGGRILLNGFKPQQQGNLVVDLTLIQSGNAPNYVVRGLSLPALDVDSEGRQILEVDLNSPQTSGATVGAGQVERRRRR